jgi:hypothetical protein
MADKEFIRNVEDVCETALVKVGFKRLRRGTIIWEFSPDFWGWVGLNKGLHGTFIRINPFVGVHAVEVMKLCAQFDGSKFIKGAYATYAIHLGEVLPTELTFEFQDGKDMHGEAERLAQSVAAAGLQYMQTIANYEALVPLLESRMSMLGGYPERYAASLYLSGKHDSARQFVAAVLNKTGDLAKFSSNFFEKFYVTYF